MVAAGTATALPLLWGSAEGAAALKPPFDVIIGSDVVYRLVHALPPLNIFTQDGRALLLHQNSLLMW